MQSLPTYLHIMQLRTNAHISIARDAEACLIMHAYRDSLKRKLPGNISINTESRCRQNSCDQNSDLSRKIAFENKIDIKK